MSEPILDMTDAGPAAEAVVRTAFAEIEAMQWGAAAALVHPETLERFRAWQLDQMQTRERHRLEPVVYDPEMAPEVVAWLEAQREKREEYEEEHGPWISHRFAGIETIDELKALSAVDLFARHLQALDPREQALRAAREEGKELPAGIERELMIDRRTVIGSVVEDDSTVVAVYRLRVKTHSEDDEGRAAVVTVRRTPEGWRILSGSTDLELFQQNSYLIYGFLTDEERVREFQRLTEEVITWPLEEGGEGRAYLTGYPGGMEPPRGLVIELTRLDGAVVRGEVPFASFGAVAELLYGWPLSEWQQ